MPQTDRHKEREIPIEFDFYNIMKTIFISFFRLF